MFGGYWQTIAAGVVKRPNTLMPALDWSGERFKGNLGEH